jgi:hypothetical protein
VYGKDGKERRRGAYQECRYVHVVCHCSAKVTLFYEKHHNFGRYRVKIYALTPEIVQMNESGSRKKATVEGFCLSLPTDLNQ